MFMQLAMWEDKMTDLERFVAIDPCLYEPIKLLPYDQTYLSYLQNEAQMHAFGEIYQMYGPDWHDKKE